MVSQVQWYLETNQILFSFISKFRSNMNLSMWTSTFRSLWLKSDVSLTKNELQSTPLNRVTLVPEHFDPIKQSELLLFLWFCCSWSSDPIKRSRLYIFIIQIDRDNRGIVDTDSMQEKCVDIQP